MNRKDFIKFRTYIVMAKRVYIYVNMHQEGQEGEYVKLSKKDLIDRLDDIISHDLYLTTLYLKKIFYHLS